MRRADYWIKHLRLTPHPEGGFYRENYRSAENVTLKGLPTHFTGERSFSTAIYFLLRTGEYSAFHRLRQDEIFHFYDGSPLTLHIIDQNGEYKQEKLGLDFKKGERPQAIMEAGWFFGATVDSEDAFSLVGCTVAPGFDFEDFTMPSKNELIELYPNHAAIIERLSK